MNKIMVIDADLSSVEENTICLIEAKTENEQITSLVVGMNILTSVENLKEYKPVAIVSSYGKVDTSSFAIELNNKLDQLEM